MNMNVNIAGVEWKNPVTVASGTFGSGEEFSEFVDLNKLGAITTKGVADVPWAGNPTPRVAEVYGGMMNAIGLQNPGIDLFCERDIPYLQKYDTKIIVNVCGHAPEEYFRVVERLADEYHATPSQIALAWMINKHPWIVPIPGTRHLSRLKENIGAVDIHLTTEEIRRIDAELDTIGMSDVFGGSPIKSK